MKELQGEEINSLLASAHCGFDFCSKRGQVSRGVFIVDASGMRYLTKRGRWTFGIEGDNNWWDRKDQAENFLAKQRLKAQKANKA